MTDLHEVPDHQLRFQGRDQQHDDRDRGVEVCAAPPSRAVSHDATVTAVSSAHT
jgi:hypothetical protein